jgi:hypothetical protein
MKKNDFFDQYKDPRWQKKRLEIMKRDEFQCQVCGDKERELNVHHRIYLKDQKIWDYENKHLITLCEDCHRMAHSERKELNLLLADIHEMFLSEYIEVIITLNRFNPSQIMYIRKFLNDMFPLSDKKFYD